MALCIFVNGRIQGRRAMMRTGSILAAVAALLWIGAAIAEVRGPDFGPPRRDPDFGPPRRDLDFDRPLPRREPDIAPRREPDVMPRREPDGAPSRATDWDISVLTGRWIYRAFNHTMTLVGTNQSRAYDLIFGEAILTLEVLSGARLRGEMTTQGLALELDGAIKSPAEGAAPVFEIIGTSRRGARPMEYHYQGQFAHRWPNGINQVPTILGTVMRARADAGGAAGFVASFFAIKQNEPPPRRR
jgi:hypothetical protein